jgi:phosphoglycolate phosphatase
MTREFWAEASNWTPPAFPEKPAVLKDLRRAGHTLVISSGGRTQVAQYRAHAAGIDGFFRLILGTDEGQAAMSKGAGHFSLIRDALTLTGAEFRSLALMVGDGPHDMQVAREAGIIAVGRRTAANDGLLTGAGAGFLIDDLTQLEGLLADLDRTLAR